MPYTLHNWKVNFQSMRKWVSKFKAKLLATRKFQPVATHPAMRQPKADEA